MGLNHNILKLALISFEVFRVQFRIIIQRNVLEITQDSKEYYPVE
jgi:hypothetical protein